LKTTLEVGQNIDQEDRDLIMRLSPIYEQRLAEARQEGQQQGMQQGIRRNVVSHRKLAARPLGTLDEELVAMLSQCLYYHQKSLLVFCCNHLVRSC
jgi:flagellar biosynthesis/type III secretory pathway protein FliH